MKKMRILSLIMVSVVYLPLASKSNNWEKSSLAQLKDAVASEDEMAVRELVSVIGVEGMNENFSDFPRTPLTFAVELGKLDMVELLLELGADPVMVDGSGDNAADLAWKMRREGPVYASITYVVEKARSGRYGTSRPASPSAPMEWLAAE